MQRLFLIGMRGAGKTSIGQGLANKLCWNFVDTDALLEQKYNCSIADMVAAKGWPTFRKRESNILQSCTQENTIYATGGGIILDENNRNFMREQGQVCFLSVPAKVIVKRLNNDTGNRPALTSQGLIAEIETVLAERLHLYKSTAHFEVDATLSIAEILTFIHLVGRLYANGN